MMLQDLRFGRFWLLFGWLAVTVAMILSLVPPRIVEVRGWNDKVEHLLGYFLLTFWFCSIYPRQRILVVGFYMLGMGALVEILQGAMGLGRQADGKDLLADLAGIVPALLLAMTPLVRWPRWLEALVPRR